MPDAPTRTATVGEVVGLLEEWYDPATAQEWDAIGLVTGDPERPASTVLLAVDPVGAVVAEAASRGAELLVTHHPLLLRAVHAIATTQPKGRLVTELVEARIALHVAHTNADVARPGVSDALAEVLGLGDTRPLVPSAGRDAGTGLGRVGSLPQPEPLRVFADRVAAALPVTAAGVRWSGDPEQPIRTVAVCGGAGDDLFGVVRTTGADAYLTADLRHHPASESREHGRPALVDVAHWASEWPWLPVLAQRLRAGLASRGATVDVHVSRVRTDPWTGHVATGDPR